MIPERCIFCRGFLKEGNSQLIARVEDEVIVIRGVLAFVCEQCGEANYCVDNSEKIDELIKDVINGKLCVKPLAAGEVELNG